MDNFHNVLFPLSVSLAASGGPILKTDILPLASGGEYRNSPHRHSRRRYDAGVGIKSKVALRSLINFFEARAGQLHSFRFRDPFDHDATDQSLGQGDGARTVFPIFKSYGDEAAHYDRPLFSVEITNVSPDIPFVVEDGALIYDTPPDEGAAIFASFTFDTIVRFDTDRLNMELESFGAGQVVSIPLVEVLTAELSP